MTAAFPKLEFGEGVMFSPPSGSEWPELPAVEGPANLVVPTDHDPVPRCKAIAITAARHLRCVCAEGHDGVHLYAEADMPSARGGT